MKFYKITFNTTLNYDLLVIFPFSTINIFVAFY